MSDSKPVKTIMDAAILTGLAAGIGWIAKKVVKESFTQDPTSNVTNYEDSSCLKKCNLSIKWQALRL